MIAGDEVSAVSRGELRERCRVRRKLLHGTVHQIARYGDQISIESIHTPHEPLHESAADRRADVQVADLSD